MNFGVDIFVTLPNWNEPLAQTPSSVKCSSYRCLEFASGHHEIWHFLRWRPDFNMAAKVIDFELFIIVGQDTLWKSLISTG